MEIPSKWDLLEALRTLQSISAEGTRSNSRKKKKEMDRGLSRV